ncbi:MAG: hypothetical protein A3C44_02160 [Gammaproteobacteria bacterium RIFCSPHIGHO2_02_FULL_39_13]|nr:MAG: hypothetical protein A3C44_02160 [Gammaproteobacteria bacterium RIFCSPHIGHO2_02_FULL_39_13]OGT48340.1 MAG: hypothetical protein A3E53_05855 [Gammaproteobacteria bacterium RIFCSPHIGHO2_12_FULL_39_24]
MKNKSREMQTYILSQVEKHPGDIATLICKRFSVTRMTAIRQLTKLIDQQKIMKSGKTSDSRYFLAESKNKLVDLKIEKTLDEFTVFQKYCGAELKTLPENQYQIAEYCCTELINNAKDHSQGTRLHLETRWENKGIAIQVRDNGVGIFKKLKTELQLANLEESLLMLTKGKVTTDSNNHTGEGIFFSSRAADRFTIEANKIKYTKDNIENDWFYEKTDLKSGTKITLFIGNKCARILKDIFQEYTNPSDYHFDKTEILVELSRFGDERYISRSQAKRILIGLEKFRRVVLDFRGIETVGQGFVDEVFRVFQNKNPAIEISYRHANDNVTFMIERGL